MISKLQPLSRMALAFLMALFSVWTWGQTQTLVNYKFENNLTPEVGSIGTPNLTASTTVSYFSGVTGQAASFSSAGGKYLELTISTLGYSNLKISFSGRSSASATTWVVTGDATGGNNLVNVTTLNCGNGSFTDLSPTLLSTSYNNKSSIKLRITSGGSSSATNRIDDLVITGTSIQPTLSVTGSFSSFTYFQGNGPSVNQSITASGSSLDGITPVTVASPSGFEVSLDGTNFADNQTISYSNNAFTNQNIFARLKSGLVAGNYSGNITISGGGASDVIKAVNGNVVDVPSVTASSFSGTIGTSFSQNIQATQSPTSYAIVSGNSLPTGLSLNTTTGLISGTPTVAGTFTTDITATNGAGSSAPATINFTIAKGVQTLTGFTNQSKYLSSTPFTFPANTTNANLAVTYSSSNPAVATVSGNTITITGVGTSNITATQAGDNNWNAFSQQVILTVANDPVTYNGVGKFEKITSLTDLTDGYYVMAFGSSQAMNNTYNSGSYLENSAINVVSNSIVNPSSSIVWKIETNSTGKTIFNELSSKYVSYTGSGNSVQIVDNVTTDNQRWNITMNGSLFVFTNAAVTARVLQYNSASPRFACYTASQQNLTLYKFVDSTTWNGSTWSNGNPDNKDVIITGGYSTTSQPAFTAKNITVKNGGVLEITSGNTIGAASVTVEDGGNFIQRDGSTLTNTGAFNVLKNTTSAANKYVFWASPTASQNMYGIHTSTPQYVMTYNSATDYYTTLGNPATSTPGVGYSVKMPNANATATFGGATAQPNNGNVAVTLNNTSTNKYNLIGNPYPSNLDLNAFYNANSSSVNSTFWFWDNTSNNVTTQTGNTTTNVGYATYNAAGSGTWTEAPSSSASHSGSSAAVGQGFIVEATGTTATFTNAMRISTTGNTFNKLNGNDIGKFWLKLATPYGSHTTLAVNYETGAQNTFDKFDSRAMGVGSDAFYSTVGAEKLVIQGKAPFTIDDVVPLGNKHFEAGNFVISLTQKEGVFNNGQAIYLHDKELGTYTNLQNGNYNFSTSAGEFTNRFEIVYKFGALATQEIEKTTFEVYKDGENFVARNSKNIEKIEIFDGSGRKIVELKPNASIVKFKLETKGMYVLRAISAGKEYTKKLIK